MESPLLALLAFLATSASLSSALPQLWRVLRTREVRGVSVASQLTLTSCLTAWTVYGVLTPDLPLLLASAVPLLTVALTCVLLAREGAGGHLRTFGVLAASLAASLAVGAQSLSALAFWGTVLGLSSMLPQLWVSWRLRCCPGLSPASWALSALRASLWLCYGAATGQTVLWVGSAAQLPIIAVIWFSALTGARAVRALQHQDLTELLPVPRGAAEDLGRADARGAALRAER